VDQYLSEVRLLPWSWAPKGWALCNGALLPIAQNQALFALLGTTYGGNGTSNFALPDLRGRTPIHFSPTYPLGNFAGTETVTLNANQLPIHNHLLNAVPAAGTTQFPNAAYLANNSNATVTNFYAAASSLIALNPASISTTTGNQPHNNMQPYLVLNYCIAITGLFPSRN